MTERMKDFIGYSCMMAMFLFATGLIVACIYTASVEVSRKRQEKQELKDLRAYKAAVEARETP